MNSFSLLSLLVVVFLISQVQSDYVKPDTSLGRFKRVIVATRDLCPFDFTLAGVVDTNRTRALSFGVATVAELALFEASAFQFIKDTFGLDFLDSGVVYSPATGFRIIPGVGYFVPAIIGDTKANGRYNFRIAYDSENPNRNGKWFNIQFSCLFLMNSTGTYSGTMTNATYVPGDILSYNWQYHLKEDANWSKKKNVEKFVSFSVNSAQSMSNQWKDPQQLIKVEVRDEDGNAGLFDEIVVSYKHNGVYSGSSCRRTRQVITFD